MEALVVVIVLGIMSLPLLVIVALVGLSGLRGRVRVLEEQLARVHAELARRAKASAQDVGIPAGVERGEAPAQVPVTPPVSSPPAHGPLPATPVGVAAFEAQAPSSAPATAGPQDAQAPLTPSASSASPARSGESQAPTFTEVESSPPPRAEAAWTREGKAPISGPERDAAWGISPEAEGPEPTSPMQKATEPVPQQAPEATLGGAEPIIQAQPVLPQRTPLRAEEGTARSGPTPTVSAEAGPDFDLGAVVRGWFTEGNVPVKVGVLVLLIGVAALLKYASDQGWLHITIGMRLAAISAVALGALAFAWRKRHSHRNFALTVQGGAIGVLLLVVFAAFKLYGMLPAGAAFGISVLLVASLGVLSVIQDARVLAVLGIFSGFLAPIWLSTGSGNHVVLFSYYALLNAGIFGIAWMRSWRELNLMGWAFTWGIGTLWGAGSYDASKYATTQPFLLLFFFLYLLLPILSVRREAPGRRGFVNGSLVFGTPLIAFSLQSFLLEGEGRPLALCALVLAAIYAGLWWWLRKRAHSLLGAAYGLLSVSFATLAVPLALSARATSAVFALEGAGLLWLGLRQRRALPELAGVGLQLAAGVAFVIGATAMRRPEPIFANAEFSGALLIAVAGFACAWWYRAAERDDAAVLFYGWGLLWWGGNLMLEVQAHVDSLHHPDVFLVLASLTALIAAEVHRVRPAPVLSATVWGAFMAAGLLVFAQVEVRGQPLASVGLAAWAVFAGCGVRSLMSLREGDGVMARVVQFTWWLIWPVLAMLSLGDLSESLELGNGWQLTLAALPWLLLMALILEAWRWVRWPMGEAFDGVRSGLVGTTLAVVGLGWTFALFATGDASPLPWLPLLNPLELTLMASLALVARWLWSPLAPEEVVDTRTTLLAVGVFVLVTNLTLRGVHHLGGVPWDADMWLSSLAQMALTTVWSVLGVVAWIAGSKGGKRTLWMAGAVLMAVVLGKLVLVDRHHLGDLLGIGSFFAYGLMCTLVGWFAPAPPREGGGNADDGKAA